MQLIKQLLFIAIVALHAFLSGCGPMPVSVVNDSLSKVPLETTGWVTGSIGAHLQKPFSFSGSPFTTHSIMFRKVGSADGGSVSYSRGLTSDPNDFPNSEDPTVAFCQRLPEGNYEISDVYFWQNMGAAGEKTFRTKSGLSIPFQVRRGEAVYIGSFIADAIWGKNFLGFPVPAGGYFSLSDQQGRDSQKIKTRCPEITAALQKALLSPAGEVNVQMVRPSQPYK